MDILGIVYVIKISLCFGVMGWDQRKFIFVQPQLVKIYPFFSLPYGLFNKLHCVQIDIKLKVIMPQWLWIVLLVDGK